MHDLQVVYPAQLIELTSTRLVSTDPNTLEITGKDFRYVDQVLINDVQSPSVVVRSKTQMYAQVPVGISAVEVNSVRVVSALLTLTPMNLLMFMLPESPRSVNGIFRLIQKFTKLLLTTPGRDIFRQDLGGGVMRAIGSTFSRGDSGGVVADMHLAVQRTERQMLALQAKSGRVPLDEQLLSAKVTSQMFSKEASALVVSIELINQTNRAAAVNLQL